MVPPTMSFGNQPVPAAPEQVGKWIKTCESQPSIPGNPRACSEARIRHSIAADIFDRPARFGILQFAGLPRRIQRAASIAAST